VLRQIKQQHPQAWVYCPADRWRSGIPDLLICSHGQFAAIELKGPGGRLAPIQQITLTRIQRAGGSTWVIRTLKELDDAILP